MNDLDNFSRQIERCEAVIKSYEDAATKQVEDIWSSTQPDIDAACELIRHQEALIAQAEAERQARKRDVLSHASKVTAPARILLADAKHQLAAISAPILKLPTECIARIMQYFNVYDPTAVLLLVSKRWNAIVKATPRLWSKITLAHGHQPLHLKGAHICRSLEHLSSVLSLSKDVPLDIELCACSEPRMVRTRRRISIISDNNLTAAPSENDLNWLDEGVILLGAEGRSRRWRTLHITSWSRENGAPFKAIVGPFDNLRLLRIGPSGGALHIAYEPLVAAIVQGAPRLSAVLTVDDSIIRRVRGWKDKKFWRNIETYSDLAPCDDLSFLAQAHRLKYLFMSSWESVPQSEPVSLPCLRTLELQWPSIEILDGFRLPNLETLCLHGARPVGAVGFRTISVPSVTSIISTSCSDVRVLQRLSTPALYHLDITAHYYLVRGAELWAWQKTFTETFDGSQFMPRPISFHMEIPISESQLLSALSLLPQIEELRIVSMNPLGSKFWNALTPRGAGGRRKSKQYCPKLRIMVVEMKEWMYAGRQVLSKAQTLELGTKMAIAREQEGQTLTHLIFSWCDGSKAEVLGSFRSLPLHPSPGHNITEDCFTDISAG